MKIKNLFLFPVVLFGVLSCSLFEDPKIQLRLNDQQNGITWDPIAGIHKYAIQINSDPDLLYVTEPGLQFSQCNLTEGGALNEIYVSAASGARMFGTAHYQFMGYVHGTCQIIFYSGFEAFRIAELNGNYAEWCMDDGPFQPAYVDSISYFGGTGILIIKIGGGFIPAGTDSYYHRYYDHEGYYRYYIIDSPMYGSTQVLEDAESYSNDAEIMDKYTVKEQQDYTDPWVDTTDVNLSISGGSSGTDQSIKITFPDNTKKYKLEMPVNIEVGYEFLKYTVKTTKCVAIRMTFVHTNPIDLYGVIIPPFSYGFVKWPNAPVWEVQTQLFGDGYDNYYSYNGVELEAYYWGKAFDNSGIIFPYTFDVLTLCDTLRIEFASVSTNPHDGSMIETWLDNITLYEE